MPKALQAGITLIEAMVVVIIVGIIAAIGAPAYQSQLAKGRLQVKAESVLNGLQLARSEALRRNTKTFFTLNSDKSWVVGCVTTVTDLNGDGQVDCPATIQSTDATEGGTTVSIVATPSSSNTATFTGLGLLASTNKDTSVPFTQINFSSSGTTQTYRTTLSNGGQSKLCDPAITTTGDPRKC